MDLETQTAYAEGYDASNNGKLNRSNPYPSTFLKCRTAWFAGWNDAQFESELSEED